MELSYTCLVSGVFNRKQYHGAVWNPRRIFKLKTERWKSTNWNLQKQSFHRLSCTTLYIWLFVKRKLGWNFHFFRMNWWKLYLRATTEIVNRRPLTLSHTCKPWLATDCSQLTKYSYIITVQKYANQIRIYYFSKFANNLWKLVHNSVTYYRAYLAVITTNHLKCITTEIR